MRRKKLEREIEKTKKIKVHEPLRTEQLKSTWKEQDHKVNSSTILKVKHVFVFSI
jgi:hypothetical protein